MAELMERLGKGFWKVKHTGNTYKRKVERTVKGNYVRINNKRIKV